MGELSSSENLEDFDTDNNRSNGIYHCICKVGMELSRDLYTGKQNMIKQYQQMVDVLFELQDKYGIGVIDLWNDERDDDAFLKKNT